MHISPDLNLGLTLNDLEVWYEGFSQYRLSEHGSIRDLSRQESDHDEEFVNLFREFELLISSVNLTDRLNKARGDLVFRRSPDGSLKVVFRLGIIQLDRPQSPSVEQPSDRLRLIHLSLELGLCDESIGLVVLILREVRT